MTKMLAENKKAYHDYQILEKIEAGLALNGQEVKSIKTRGASLAGSYVIVKDEEVFWIGANIPAYQPKNAPSDYMPERSRKLLLKKDEIKSLIGSSIRQGLTFIPLKLYTERGKIKLEFGVAKGLKKADKRQVIKKREFSREKEKYLKTNK